MLRAKVRRGRQISSDSTLPDGVSRDDSSLWQHITRIDEATVERFALTRDTAKGKTCSTMPKPSPVLFPVDRSSLLLIVRSFVGLLAERVAGGDGDEAGCDCPLPGGLSLDGIACSLLAYAREVEALPLGIEEDDDDEKLAEIAETLRAMVEAAPPDADAGDVRRN